MLASNRCDKWVFSATPSAGCKFDDTKVADVFSGARERAASDHMKASASELLMAFPVIRHFCLSVVQPTGALQLGLRSVKALCSLLDLMVGAKRGRLVDAVRRTQEFLIQHKAAV